MALCWKMHLTLKFDIQKLLSHLSAMLVSSMYFRCQMYSTKQLYKLSLKTGT